MTCPVCDSNSLSEFLSREQVPVHQNLLMRDQAAATDIPRGDLALVACHDCGFIFNRAFDPRKIMYGEDYENTQACSRSFNEYLDRLVRHMIVEQDVRDCHVVEVGCGNGLFLRKLVAYDGAGNRGYGFDPSGTESELDGRLKFATQYYDSDCANVLADVIICRYVIEHVPRPLQLLEDIKKALARAPKGPHLFETPCVEWILANLVVWDFFYEHCSYFSAGSLSTAFQPDESRQLIDCVVDLNPLKQGHYVPGTGHPIVSYQALTARGVSTAILMNPNYREENLALLRAAQADVRLIDQL